MPDGPSRVPPVLGALGRCGDAVGPCTPHPSAEPDGRVGRRGAVGASERR